MVKIALKISCSVTNIHHIRTIDEYFDWNLKLQCRKCNETDKNWHAINLAEGTQSAKGTSTVNFQMKCKLCSTVSSINIVPDSIKPLKSKDDEDIVKQTAVIFDCRGIEPVDFKSQEGWVATNEDTGTVFDDVEFGDDAIWAGYDEKGHVPVSIDNFRGTFEKV